MNFLSPSVAVVVALLRKHATAAADTWRSDLPWDELESSLSPGASLVDTKPAAYIEECSPEFDKDYDDARSLHGIIDQPSGLCLPHFFCAFENCVAHPEQANRTVAEGILASDVVPNPTLYSEMDPTVKGWVEDLENPSYNLPSKVIFPVVANDVVVAIKFAKQHNLEVSVKNSGHSFIIASSKGNTLHINMNKYKQYAVDDGIHDCVGGEPTESDGLRDQPCRLSLDKNKTAVLRVGGGEQWGEVYGAVQNANKAQADGYKYHAVGGAAATVSPMGWTFHGGLSGTTAGRALGFGVDQVLQIEMVLPNGQHIRFGPTEWEVTEASDVPKTLSVSGLCNASPEASEDAWQWESCPDDINFDDLWFAVRGGGGGTWGVILSMYLQIHDYMPLERIYVRYKACVQDKLDENQSNLWDSLSQVFEIKFLLDPTSINITEAQSSACGWALHDVAFSCYGEGSGTFFDTAWKSYLDDNRSILENGGIASEIIDERINCPSTTVDQPTTMDSDAASASSETTILKYNDWVEVITNPADSPYYPGQAVDIPPPGYASGGYRDVCVLVPRKWLLDNIDSAIEMVPPSISYRAFGGKASSAVSDGLNSLSTAHREAAYFVVIPIDLLDVINFFEDILPEWYDTSGEFPAFLGANHATMNVLGPLKDDWTKACPLDWTKEERDEKCISQQEIIWGAKTLKRLEEIKMNVDPQFMFNCNGCVGNNLRKDEVDAPTRAPTDDPAKAPTNDTSAAALGAMVRSLSYLFFAATSIGSFINL